MPRPVTHSAGLQFDHDPLDLDGWDIAERNPSEINYDAPKPKKKAPKKTVGGFVVDEEDPDLLESLGVLSKEQAEVLRRSGPPARKLGRPRRRARRFYGPMSEAITERFGSL